MRLRCPKCDTLLEVADDLKKSQIKCSACGAVLKVRARRTSSIRCASCGAAVSGDAAICVNCGLNLKTGEYVQAGTHGEEERHSALPIRIVEFIGAWLPGLFLPRVLVASILVAAVGLGVMGFGLFLLGLGTLVGAILVGAVGVVVYGQAVAWLVGGDLSLLPEALSNFDGARWALFFALLLAPFTVGIGMLPK